MHLRTNEVSFKRKSALISISISCFSFLFAIDDSISTFPKERVAVPTIGLSAQGFGQNVGRIGLS
jgi:hypothetical protein